MRYYISDLHFFHENLNFRMDERGFESVEDMHLHMIEQWNKKVKKKDEVVILGDFSIGKAEETAEIIKKLNGKKSLIIGNHDRFIKQRTFDSDLFEWIHHYRELNDNSRKVILSHYPIFCYNGQYRTNKKGEAKTYMLYGHVHNTYDEVIVNDFIKQTRQRKRILANSDEHTSIPCQMINCFCMFSDYQPLSLDEWIEVDKQRRANMPIPEDVNVR